MTKTMTLPIRHGAYDCHTPPEARKFLLPSVAEERRTLSKHLKEKEERRKYLKGLPELFSDADFSREYRDLGMEINDIHQRLNVINCEFKKQTEESFESMFVRAAKNVLLPEEFERLKRYAFQMLNELSEQTHLDEPA